VVTDVDVNRNTHAISSGIAVGSIRGRPRGRSPNETLAERAASTPRQSPASSVRDTTTNSHRSPKGMAKTYVKGTASVVAKSW